MEAQIIGSRNVNFVNDAGQPVNGVKVYVAFKEENVEGLCAAEFFLNGGIGLAKDIKVNDKVEIMFTRRGKVEKISKSN